MTSSVLVIIRRVLLKTSNCSSHRPVNYFLVHIPSHDFEADAQLRASIDSENPPIEGACRVPCHIAWGYRNTAHFNWCQCSARLSAQQCNSMMRKCCSRCRGHFWLELSYCSQLYIGMTLHVNNYFLSRFCNICANE